MLFATNLVAQDWYKQIANQSKLIDKITNNEDWNSIYTFAVDELGIGKELLLDLSAASKFKSTIKESTQINQFFQNICDSSYYNFPYRRSGHLTDELYIIPKRDTSKIWQIISQVGGKDLIPKFAEIVNIDEYKLIPELIEYLKNDAATRLCIKPIDWDELPYYLSISDVAMELLEVKTYCDFFNNASQGNKLFSNLEQDEKEKIIDQIKNWWNNSNELSTAERIEFYLSTCEYGHSYKYTCHNLLYYGDTAKAIKMYSMFYDSLRMPCRKEWDIGEILMTLGDRRVIEDCMNTSTNFRCMDKSSMKCVDILLQSEYAYYRDSQLAEIVATEPHSLYRKSRTGPNYIWHKIFGELGNYDKFKLPKTLVELMKIKDAFNSISRYYTHKWTINYSEELLSSSRICDLALIKYGETIEELGNANWESIEERNKMIKSLIEKYE